MKKIYLFPLALFILAFIIINQISFKGDIISSIVIFVGVAMNFLCVFFNGFKMPVYYGGRETENHFPYRNKKKIKFWIFSDIFAVAFPKFEKKTWSGGIFSIGDIFIFFGIIWSVIVFWV